MNKLDTQKESDMYLMTHTVSVCAELFTFNNLSNKLTLKGSFYCLFIQVNVKQITV